MNLDVLDSFFWFERYSVISMSANFEQLTHLVYEASLDNSLWPELILELTKEVQSAGDSRFWDTEDNKRLKTLSQHVRRAFSISERMIVLQERETYLSSILNSFSTGVAMLDEEGQVLMANRSMQEVLQSRPFGERAEIQCVGGDESPKTLAGVIGDCIQCGVPQQLTLNGEGQEPMILLPRKEAERIGFPSVAAAVLISAGRGRSDVITSFATSHGLTRRETELLAAMCKTAALRRAAAAIGLSYESARTYVKRIYEKTGYHSQTALMAALTESPMASLRRSAQPSDEHKNVRRMLKLKDGRNLEYFSLGPENGHQVLVFDALAGVAIDVIGYPDLCLSYLDKYNIRLIIPCRPGAFRSDPKAMTSLQDFTPDLEQLMAHLGLDRVGVMANSFGCGSALAAVHGLGDRVERVVLASAAYPIYRHKNWRELDQFYHMSAILGRHWPSMLRQIIPFLVRSVLQNTDNYFDRYCRRTQSVDDVKILSHPVIRRRIAAMLAQRTAMGMGGIVDENLLNAQGWDFAVKDIMAPVEIFQGEFDNVAPLQGAGLLAQHLPNGQLITMVGKGHYHQLVNWPWLVARAAGLDVAPDSDRYCIPDL